MGSLERSSDDTADRYLATQRLHWGDCMQKDNSARDTGATILDVSREGGADIFKQWELGKTAPFAMDYYDAVMPVDAISGVTGS